jgi:uncharacterized phiE125 gp8 family phage protein
MKSYGSLNLTATSPVQTFSEPLTLAIVKEYLNLPLRSPTDADEDSMLEDMIKESREVAEILQGRDLVRKQWDLSLDYFPYEIELRAPLVTVDLVRYRDSSGGYTTLTENTDYIVDTAKHPGIIMPAYGESWPSFTHWPTSAVLVRHTSGYSATDAFWDDAGARIKRGMLLLINHWFVGRLPFEMGNKEGVNEYPYTVTRLLSYGALERVR